MTLATTTPMAKLSDRKRVGTLKHRIAIGLALVSLVAWAALAIVMIVNARIATSREVEASFFIAERYARGQASIIERSDDPRAALARLYGQLKEIRHVSASMAFSDGSPVPVASDPGDDEMRHEEDEAEAPAFFANLIQSSEFHTQIPVVDGTRTLAVITLHSNAEDEIAEVWEDFRFILPMAMIYGLLLSAVALVLVNTVFRRLDETSRALSRLRAGETGTRLPEAGFAEFAPVAAGFNELASSLAAEKRSNHELANRLLTAHDEERRRLASDLHDEVGPNLFSVRANLSYLKRRLGERDAKTVDALHEPLETLEGSVTDVQLLMRQILSRMKPVMIGDVPLASAIETLAFDYRRVTPHPLVEVDFATADMTFGETVDLTVHRFVSEAILNALRHGGAKSIDVRASMSPMNEFGRRQLEVTIRDDGRGLTAQSRQGIGLSSVRERVHTLGGTLSGPQSMDGRTCVSIALHGLEAKVAKMARPPAGAVQTRKLA
ncbi:hypothetical protein DYI37_10870 [Fulvimarina endophytica]|uniref:HAMP domain-containing protein n=1 Tax=Fulvimarina endophytica TaxID=2293836 RepID=A0A371X2S7_9HYPH|nr:histidine kinase [Fulvimarina endophytica]RFC63513.1 hypothetical protein DYI37_10870 [Fulvimarina endophytica]